MRSEGTSFRRSGRPDGDLFLAGPKTYAPRYDRGSRFHRYGYLSPYPVIPVPYYLPSDFPISPAGADYSAPLDAPSDAGYLELDLSPGTTQIYIDGFFVGSADDDDGSRYVLRMGSHRIELRAEGFEPAAFDVRIRPAETIIYTRRLERLGAPPPPLEPAAAPPPAAKTLYVIPRCYAGDRRPLASDLPARCSLADLRVVN